MKTIQIHGKDYVSVNERIKYFRENFNGWGLLSELISDIDGKAIMKALVIDPDGDVKATGFAYEKEGNSNINKTSYIENCETSAWGRALGNFGIGIDASVASYDEVANTISNQKTPSAPLDEAPVELNRSVFGQPDDNELIAELKKVLAKAVSDMIVSPDKMSETLEASNGKHGERLSVYVDTVQNRIDKLRLEVQA